ncbi:type III-B CRISPR module RAMP protein Cmr6 [Vibrio gazogenes]|uniref:Type III-B CRISPR module RAMP protein Cmr6 n=1 Tax=Vibrio gazogenes TaxID=687 RepID=A0A1Z2SF08_VIBGA|nr:type III-B CRISPR module RAMP protein Cmr6 [Vibrio gazogenes]ASA55741.1 type III-B CRISPR module RAMP protein Cmr6 [Vibrio gazogenes]
MNDHAQSAKPQWHHTLNWGLLYNKYFLTSNPQNLAQIGKETDTTRFFSLMCQGHLSTEQWNECTLLTVGKGADLIKIVRNTLQDDQHALSSVCQRYTHRQCEMVKRLKGSDIQEQDAIKTVTCVWRFVNGLSMPHLMGVNLFWHPTLGIPYLPGSALKGILKSFLMNTYPLNDAEKHDADFIDFIRRVFGSDECPETSDTDHQTKNQAGDYIFFDALPTQKMTFVTDVMTPHFGNWYQDGATKTGQLNTTPNDWHDPVPIPFLALEDFELQLAVLPRPGSTEKAPTGELAFITDMLCSALSYQGAGAKSAVGYGYFEVSPRGSGKEHNLT